MCARDQKKKKKKTLCQHSFVAISQGGLCAGPLVATTVSGRTQMSCNLALYLYGIRYRCEEFYSSEMTQVREQRRVPTTSCSPHQLVPSLLFLEKSPFFFSFSPLW